MTPLGLAIVGLCCIGAAVLLLLKRGWTPTDESDFAFLFFAAVACGVGAGVWAVAA